MSQTLKFHNYSPESFTGTWDSVPYTIKAGDVILLQTHLALHFAKHLSDREMNRDGIEPLTQAAMRPTYIDKAIVIDDEVEETEEMNSLEVEQEVVRAVRKKQGKAWTTKGK